MPRKEEDENKENLIDFICSTLNEREPSRYNQKIQNLDGIVDKLNSLATILFNPSPIPEIDANKPNINNKDREYIRLSRHKN